MSTDRPTIDGRETIFREHPRALGAATLHTGGPGPSRADTARVLGLELARQQQREERAVAKLRHPCTPGDLTHLKEL